MHLKDQSQKNTNVLNVAFLNVGLNCVNNTL